MTKLDEIALNVELILISIIEAVALTFLAENTIDVLRTPEWPQLLPYIIAGLIILLVFWSQAILHAVSFVRWPLRMEHMLLYFVAAFTQVIAYSYLSNPLLWFVAWSGFSILVLVIYVVDLKIIRESRTQFGERGDAHMTEVERRHLNELRYLVPISVLFNFVCVFLLFAHPEWGLGSTATMTLGVLQALISLGALVDCVRNFRARAQILPQVLS